MKIFIFGGGGILGRHLATRLADDNHDIHIVDVDTLDISNDDRITCHGIHEGILSTSNLHMLIYTHKPDVIYHLAETTTIDPTLVVDYSISNISITAHVLKFCAQYGIRGFICGWHELDETNMMTFSLNKKHDIVNFFHRGNCVVNSLQLPYLLHADYPISGYGTFINRLFNNVYYNQQFFIDESEEHIISKETIPISSIDYAVESILALLTTRTRDTMIIPGYRISPQTLFGIALDVFNCDSTLLVGRNEPREFKRYTKDEHGTVRRWIKNGWQAIDSEGASG